MASTMEERSLHFSHESGSEKDGKIGPKMGIEGGKMVLLEASRPSTSSSSSTHKEPSFSGAFPPPPAPQAAIAYMPPAPSTDAGIIPTIQNVVAAVNTGCQLDLRKINFYTRNSEYNPSRFCGIVMRLRDPRATALIFSSGKIVTTGTKHEASALLASRKFVRIIQKLGFVVKFQGFQIHNMVSTCDLRFPIRLENLNQVHGQFSSYEPELFPALIYRMVKPRVVLLIFVNGKIVITGAKSREETQEALDNIHRVLKSFRKS